MSDYMVKINFQITKPGIYVLDSKAAIGKTALARIMRVMQEMKITDKYKVITYSKDIDMSNLCAELLTVKEPIIFFDRADLYMTTELLQTIKQLNAIILIDHKETTFWNRLKYSFCEIILEKDQITVKEII